MLTRQKRIELFNKMVEGMCPTTEYDWTAWSLEDLGVLTDEEMVAVGTADLDYLIEAWERYRTALFEGALAEWIFEGAMP